MEEFSPYIWQMWGVLALIGIALISFSMERLTLELTSLCILAALVLFFYIFPVPDQTLTTTVLLSGLANPALITIMALLVIGQGLFQTEALEGPARLIARVGVNQPHLIMVLTFLCVMLASAFLNNTPVVVMFIPIFAALAARMGRPASQVMMPLSFMCTLGGMTTLIGSSTNLLAAESAQAAGYTVNFFDLTIPGLVLALPGALYVIFVMPHLLPDRQDDSFALEEGDGKQFIAQITLAADNPLIGMKSTAGLFPDLTDITVRMIQRGEQPILPPFEETTLKEGDILIVAATRKTLTEFLTSQPGILHMETFSDAQDEEPTLTVAETVVAPASRIIGRSIEQHGFRHLTDCIVLGIQRRSRMIRSHMSDIRLEAGDVLLLLGKRNAIRNLRHNRDLLLLEWSALNVPLTGHATRALLIFAATVLCAATGLLPIPCSCAGRRHSHDLAGPPQHSSGHTRLRQPHLFLSRCCLCYGPCSRSHRRNRIPSLWVCEPRQYHQSTDRAHFLVFGHRPHHKPPQQQCHRSPLHTHRNHDRNRTGCAARSVYLLRHFRCQLLFRDPHRLPNQSARYGARALHLP